jgi:hypothetical protein
MVALRISSLVNLGGIDTVDPLEGDACMRCRERERILSVGTPWGVDRKNCFELDVLVSTLVVMKEVEHAHRESSC